MLGIRPSVLYWSFLEGRNLLYLGLHCSISTNCSTNILDKWILSLNGFRVSSFFLSQANERKLTLLILTKCVGEKIRSDISSSTVRLMPFYKLLLFQLFLKTIIYGILPRLVFIQLNQDIKMGCPIWAQVVDHMALHPIVKKLRFELLSIFCRCSLTWEYSSGEPL